eukprot:5549384-Amphidinium_carterae.1
MESCAVAAAQTFASSGRSHRRISPFETPGLSSTDILPAAEGDATNSIAVVEPVISDPVNVGEVIRAADTLLDSTDANSS